MEEEGKDALEVDKEEEKETEESSKKTCWRALTQSDSSAACMVLVWYLPRLSMAASLFITALAGV